MVSVSNTCFNCNTKIEDDSYGLTQCPSCQAPIFIDFDGHVQKPPDDDVVDEQEASDHLNEPMVAEEGQSAEEQKESSDDFISFDQSFQTEAHLEDQNKITDQQKAFEDSPHESSFLQEVPGEFSDETKPPSDFDTSQDEPFTDMSAKGTNDAHKEHHFEGLEPKDDDVYKSEKVNKDHQEMNLDNKPLQDVIDYANSSDNLDLGDFYYNVIVSGIDSKNLRESVLDALDDSRFGWKKEEVGSQIKNGCLNLERINAAKTYILISYLKFLPVKVRWDQVFLTKS